MITSYFSMIFAKICTLVKDARFAKAPANLSTGLFTVLSTTYYSCLRCLLSAVALRTLVHIC